MRWCDCMIFFWIIYKIYLTVHTTSTPWFCFTGCTAFYIFYPCFFLRTRQLFIVTLQGLSCVLTDRFHLPLYLYSVLPIFSSCIDSALYGAIAGVARCTGDKLLEMAKLGGVVLQVALHFISTYTAFASLCEKNAPVLS